MGTDKITTFVVFYQLLNLSQCIRVAHIINTDKEIHKLSLLAWLLFGSVFWLTFLSLTAFKSIKAFKVEQPEIRQENLAKIICIKFQFTHVIGNYFNFFYWFFFFLLIFSFFEIDDNPNYTILHFIIKLVAQFCTLWTLASLLDVILDLISRTQKL